MAVTIYAADGSRVPAANTISLPVDVGTNANRYLLVFYYDINFRTFTSLKYGGTDLTPLGSVVRGGALYGLANPTSGSNTLTLIVGGSVTDMRMHWCAMYGVHPTTPLGTVQTDASPSGGYGASSYVFCQAGYTYTAGCELVEGMDLWDLSTYSPVGSTQMGTQFSGNSVQDQWAHRSLTTSGTNDPNLNYWGPIPASHQFSIIGVIVNPAAGSPPTATTLNGPSSGAVNVASGNFTIGTDNPVTTGSITVTPATSISGGGTFSPSTVTLTSSATTGTFTFTPAKSGAHTISISDTGGLTDATPLTYTVQPAVTVKLVAGPTDSTPQSNLTNLHWTWRDYTDINSTTPPTDHGSTGTTDASGFFTVALPNSTKTNGQNGLIEITNAGGTVVGLAVVPVT